MFCPQIIQLPQKDITITAFAFPASNDYSYSWNLISHPSKAEGAMQDANTATVKLSNLIDGTYLFKIDVTGKNGEAGSNLVNLTVLPQLRVNKSPVAIIQPDNSTVQLPNKGRLNSICQHFNVLFLITIRHCIRWFIFY